MSKFNAVVEHNAVAIRHNGQRNDLAIAASLGPDPRDLPILKLWQAIEAQLSHVTEKIIQIASISEMDEDHSVAHRLGHLASNAMQGGVLLLNSREAELRQDEGGFLGFGPLPGRNGDIRAYNCKLLTEFWNNLRAQAQLVILDTPPLLDSPLAQAMAPSVDGVILVVEAEKTTERQAKAARDALEKSGANILGVVFNKVPRHIPRKIDRKL